MDLSNLDEIKDRISTIVGTYDTPLDVAQGNFVAIYSERNGSVTVYIQSLKSKKDLASFELRKKGLLRKKYFATNLVSKSGITDMIVNNIMSNGLPFE